MSLVNEGSEPIESSPAARDQGASGFLPAEPARHAPESLLVRLVATAGIVGIATGIGAILSAADVAGWVLALVVALVSVCLAAVLWRSRVL
jgi:hypothetical protein